MSDKKIENESPLKQEHLPINFTPKQLIGPVNILKTLLKYDGPIPTWAKSFQVCSAQIKFLK